MLNKDNSVLIIGDVMLDHYINGEVKRISPEAPVPVLKFSNEYYVLGGAANVANNLAHLEIDCCLFGVIGNNKNEVNIINQLLKTNKIGDSLVPYNGTTTLKTRVVAQNYQLVRIDREDTSPKDNVTIPRLIELLEKFTGNFIIISDYAKGVCTHELVTFVLDYAFKTNKKVLIDPKGNNWDKYRGAFLVKPNLKELKEIVGVELNNDDSEIVNYGRMILEKYNILNLLITRSKKGMTLLNKNNEFHFFSKAKEVFDVSGAGDTVIATLVYGLMNNKSLFDAVELGNKAAGIVVAASGTTPISIDNLS